MKQVKTIVLAGILLGTLATPAGAEAEPGVLELSAFPVYAGSHFSHGIPIPQLSDRMAREARVDLQTRGGTRYQTDISIRGGIFEGTALMVGGMTLFDPQTGHYFSEIPLDPAFFGGAYLLTGVENGLRGFNSTAGAIDWQWGDLREGGTAYARAGTDALVGGGFLYTGSAGKALYTVSLMTEQGDGSIANGDFELTRLSARVETGLGKGRLRLFGGYLDKFYGWPGMYTGFALNETDEYAVSLLGWQWESRGGSGSRHRIGGYWRELDDDYEFNRENPNTFFEHKTEVYSLQGDGMIALEGLDLLYNWAFVRDRILRSTSLVNGHFQDRDYGEAAFLLRRGIAMEGADLMIYGGLALDTSNRDSTVVLPQAGISLSGIAESVSWKAYLEYSEASQVPGYTALNSAPTGLFGGNPDLGRETSDTVEGGLSFQTGSLSGRVVAFHRRDRDLVDWVYRAESVNARRAAPVDIDVTGLEGWIRWEGESTAVEAGYAWLDKDEAYQSSLVDASFYALNYARHRLLLTLEQALTRKLQLRIEGEYRRHPENPLRTSSDEALRLHAELAWREFITGWTAVLRGENLTEEDFQSFPGSPGPGREITLTLGYSW